MATDPPSSRTPASAPPSSPHPSSVSPASLPEPAGAPRDTCVARVPIFSLLSPEDQQAVASFAHPVDLERGQQLYRADDPLRRLFVVHHGKLKLVRTSVTGREHLLRVVGPGDVVGEHTFLTGTRPDFAVQVLEPAQMCVFDHRDLATLVRRFPAISVAMLRSLSDRLVASENRLALAGAEVPVRVAEYLLALPSQATTAEGHPLVRWPLPKRDVAALLGTTPESLSRALARLRDEGLVIPAGDAVALPDLDALEERARY